MTVPSSNAAKNQAAQPDTSLYITRFPSLKEPHGEEDSYADWEEFYTEFEKDYDEIHDKSDGRGWSPARFLGEQRALKNVDSVSCLVLDYDQGTTHPEAAFFFWSMDAFLPLMKSSHCTACLVHTTFSHSPEHPKFRVIMPFSRPVDVKEFEVIWTYVADLAEKAGHQLDPLCKDASRMWLVPAARPGVKPRFLSDGGLPIDVKRVLKECGYKARTAVKVAGNGSSVLQSSSHVLEARVGQVREAVSVKEVVG